MARESAQGSELDTRALERLGAHVILDLQRPVCVHLRQAVRGSRDGDDHSRARASCKLGRGSSPMHGATSSGKGSVSGTVLDGAQRLGVAFPLDHPSPDGGAFIAYPVELSATKRTGP